MSKPNKQVQRMFRKNEKVIKIGATAIVGTTIALSCYSYASADTIYDDSSYRGIGYMMKVDEVGVNGNGGTIGFVKSDAGGVSYGICQMATNAGTPDNFVEWLKESEDYNEYYKFFEEYKKISELAKTTKFNFNLAIPNTACPSPHTKEDGLLFANLCKLSYEIEQDNKENNIFTYYQSIMPFNRKSNKKDTYNYGTCGTTRNTIGLLPNKMLSGCHNGFVELISDYKKYCNEETPEGQNSTLDFNLFLNNQHNNKMVFPYKDLEKYRHQMEAYYKPNACFQIINLVSEIQFLSFNNQIDTKYLNLDEAIKGANFFGTHTSYCIRDNIGSTGSKSLVPVGLIKLLLNGAREYIELEQNI